MQFCNGTDWVNMGSSDGGTTVSDGDKGDITVSSSGAAWAIDSGAVTNTMLAGSIALSKLSITGTPDGSKFLRDDGAWAAVPGISDGDKGSITVSSSGAAWTIDNSAVTNAMLAGSIALSKLSITGTPDGSKFLRDDGSWQVVSTNAAGSDTQVQFNDGGTAFGGDAGLTYNKTTDALTVAGALSSAALTSAAHAITSTSASALVAGANGSTNPVLKVDASTASVATGISITGAAATARAALAVLSSGTNEGLSIDAKGSGTIRLGATSTGAVEFSRNAVPTASDGAALGTTSLMWSDLFLASGAVVNFNNGDVTLTHSADTLTLGGGNLALGSNNFSSTGTLGSGTATVTSTSASALTVGANGATNPVLKVDANTASVATGISITGAAATGRAALAVLSSGTNEGLSIDAKGSGTIRLGAVSTGAVEFSRDAVPTASDGAALGTSSLMWSDLFLASGSVINFNNGDVTLTHSADTLTVAGGNLAGSGSGLTSLNASNLASGTVPTARLGTGTADSTTYLRGDGSWQAPAGGGANYQEFTASGTWTKPGSGNIAFVQCWGGGGGGGRWSSAGSGGGGGGYNESWIPMASLGATVTVTIGAGGAGRTGSNGAGTVGGNTTFGSYLTAYGGGPGTNDNSGGGGGGPLGAGSTYSSGLPKVVVSADSPYGYTAVYEGDGCTNVDVPNNSGGIYHGGGGGGNQASACYTGGNSIRGGGGGGRTGYAGGTSFQGGAGGAGSSGSGVTASNGSQPGGGGGGGYNANGGNGGAGLCRVTVF